MLSPKYSAIPVELGSFHKNMYRIKQKSSLQTSNSAQKEIENTWVRINWTSND